MLFFIGGADTLEVPNFDSDSLFPAILRFGVVGAVICCYDLISILRYRPRALIPMVLVLRSIFDVTFTDCGGCCC